VYIVAFIIVLCIDLFSCKAASLFTINLLTYLRQRKSREKSFHWRLSIYPHDMSKNDAVMITKLDLLAIKGHRPLTYHIIVHIAIGKKETMTMQSCKLHKQINDQYLVNRLTCTLLIVFLNNNKLLKFTMDSGKLIHKPATRSVNNDVSHSYDLCSKRSCRGHRDVTR